MNPPIQQYVKAALTLLGIDRLALVIHDQSFPSLDREEIGRGSPYSYGGCEFLRFISQLGFNTLQLGPQGKTSSTNPSPYDSTLFSKNEVSASLLRLVDDPNWNSLLSGTTMASLVNENPSKNSARNQTSYRYAYHAVQQALKQAHNAFISGKENLHDLHTEYAHWCEVNAWWLERESLYEALAAENGTDDWRTWEPEDQRLGVETDDRHAGRKHRLCNRHQQQMEMFHFGQFIVHRQHQQFRRRATTYGIKLFGDMQIGCSPRDFWCLRELFLSDYLLGAPPSRTNPEGQPWGYPVIDPDLYFQSPPSAPNAPQNYGAGLQFVKQRIDKLLADFDGLRIDHPHGIICPWVYKSGQPDQLKAVQSGARLFESPDINDHLQLAHYAIARPDQLNRTVERFADNWVKTLEPEQVERYCLVVDLIQQRLRASGLDESDLLCEVLSSCPYPLKSVLARQRLGRLRVAQKADPANAADAYRTDTAAAPDWVMVGTHDTKPLQLEVSLWHVDRRQAWARYLAKRLSGNLDAEAEMTDRLMRDTGDLLQSMFADLFIGPARNVSIFFADLLGIDEIYNRPGIISDTNWTLSVSNDYKRSYADKLTQRQALDLPRTLAIALKAKAAGAEGTAAQLASKLEECPVPEL